MIYNTSDFVAILNNQISENMLNSTNSVLAENLDSLVDYGKAVTSLSADDLKHWSYNIVVGVYNKVVNRLLATKNFKFLKDSVAFGGAMQRLMASGLLEPQVSHIRNLNYAHGTYHDGKFYGVPFDAKIYLEEEAMKFVVSTADDFYKSMFTSFDELNKALGIIATNLENSMTAYFNELSKRLLVAVCVDALTHNRKIQLLTQFNSYLGKSGASALTINDIKADRKLMAYFSDFCKMTISKVIDYMGDINKKYNDGTVVTFAPKEKINAVFISEFLREIEFIGNPVDFNLPSGISADSISCWQSTTNAILPDFSKVSQIQTTDENEGPPKHTYNNVVGIVYDEDCAGIIQKLNKTTVEPVGAEGFINYHHHTVNSWYVDSRLGAVVFTLD